MNQAGGIHGKKIRLITYDDRGDAKEAGTAVTRLIDRDQVAAVLGEVASGLSLAGAPVCQENGIPMITPSSTAPEITAVGDRIFRVCFMKRFQAYACAKFARERLKAQTAGDPLRSKTPLLGGAGGRIRKTVRDHGGSRSSRLSYQEGDQDYSAQLTSIRGGRPDIVFIPGYYTDVANIAVQARKLGIRVPLVGRRRVGLGQAGGDRGKAIDGCYFCTHYFQQDPLLRASRNSCGTIARIRDRPRRHGRAGIRRGQHLVRGLEKTQSQSGADLAATLAATKDFDGVTGPDLDRRDRNAVKPAVILEMKHGVPTLAATIEPPSSAVQ